MIESPSSCLLKLVSCFSWGLSIWLDIAVRVLTALIIGIYPWYDFATPCFLPFVSGEEFIRSSVLVAA